MRTDADLAFGLARAGIPLVAMPSSAAPGSPPPSAGDLLAALAVSSDPLFRTCAVPLLLTCPGAVDAAEGISQTLRGADRAAFLHLYEAAVCLRRLWKTRLAMGVKPLHDLPDRFSRGLGLPPPEDLYGEPCLAEIARRFDTGEAGARIRGVEKMLAHLMEQTFALLDREPAGAPAR